LRNILFDLDGTLTDPFLGITRCLAHAVERLGVRAPPAHEMARHIGPPIRESIAALLGEHSSEDNVALALSHYRERYRSVGMFENEPYAGVKQMLHDLREMDVRLYVATSKPHVFARPILHHFALGHYFTTVFGSELSGQNEDKRELLREALAQALLDPNETAMVGDRSYDMHAGRAHRLLTIGVTYGYGTEAELTEAGAEVLCDSPASVVDCLRRHRAATTNRNV
jgi:phosphoglycolate phosphatase